MVKVVIAVIATIIAGMVGLIIEFDANIPNVSAILSIATMGGFIMNELRKK